MTDQNQHLGSTLDSLLGELDELEEIESLAIKRIENWEQNSNS